MAAKVNEISLNCSICLRRFRKPRILPCLHSYCEDCLLEYAPRGTERLACPLCGVKVDIPDGDVTTFKLDFRLQSQVDDANRYDVNETGVAVEMLTCNCCQDKAEALAKCHNCDRILCIFGMKAHESFASLSQHTVTLLGDDEVKQVEQTGTRLGSLHKRSLKHSPEKRAVLVSDLPRLEYSPARIRDRLTIHFQKRSNNGGDVDRVIYPLHGCLQYAVVIFSDRQTCISVLRCEHFFQDFQIKMSVEALPQIFKEIKADVNDFYLNLIPRMEMKSLIDSLPKMIGKENLKIIEHILRSVVCTADQLLDVHRAIVKAISLKHSSSSSESAIARGIFVKDIPYLTNDVDQLRDELKKHLESDEISQVESLMCPVKGNTSTAIALFKSSQDREDYITHRDKCFHGELLDVIKLPPIFKTTIATLDTFYSKLIPQLEMSRVHAQLRDMSQPQISIHGDEMTATFDQIIDSVAIWLEALVLSPSTHVDDILKEDALSDRPDDTKVPKGNDVSGTPEAPTLFKDGDSRHGTNDGKGYLEDIANTGTNHENTTAIPQRGSNMGHRQQYEKPTGGLNIKGDVESSFKVQDDTASAPQEHNTGSSRDVTYPDRIRPFDTDCSTRSSSKKKQENSQHTPPNVDDINTAQPRRVSQVNTYKAAAAPVAGITQTPEIPEDSCTNALATATMEFCSSEEQKHLRQISLVNRDQEATSALQKISTKLFPSRKETDDSEVRPKQSPLTGDINLSRPMKFKTDEGIEVVVTKGDITKGKADAIVNAANGRLLQHGGGVAGAIAKAAGKGIREESRRIMARYKRPLQVGECEVTEGYNLNCKVIHAVGPIYSDYKSDSRFIEILKKTFLEAIRCANIPIKAKRVDIPLISSGIYGGPKHLCAKALVDAVMEFSKSEKSMVIKQIYLVNIDDESTIAVRNAFQTHFSPDASMNQCQNK